MKMTKKAGASSKSLKDTILPAVSGNLKSSADVPKGSIFEAVTTITTSFLVS